jgi:hypothetical protein
MRALLDITERRAADILRWSCDIERPIAFLDPICNLSEAG